MSAKVRWERDTRQASFAGAWAAPIPADREALLLAVHRTAQCLRTFTATDVWLRLPKGRRIVEPRLLGAVLREAVRRGWCRPTDRLQRSEDWHFKREWRSLVQMEER